MTRRNTYDVCTAVASHLPFDARVWKEARSLAAAGYDVSLMGLRYDARRIEQRREAGLDVTEIPFGARRARQRRQRAAAVLRLWSRIVTTNARVYHAHNIHTIAPAWLASRVRRATLVYDAHELYGDTSRAGRRARVVARIEGALERLAARASDVVITTNASRAATLRERYGLQRVEVLANVPALVETVEPLDPGFPAGPVLLYQGGVYPESRAFRETIDAVSLLDDVQLVILGFGREETFAAVRRWADDAGVGTRVHFLPPRPFDELVRTAASATVGIVPIKPDSPGAFLGDTNKLHEYLMAGLPVVASDLPEIRRVVTAGDPPVGELFDPSSPASIADAVRRVLRDPAKFDARRREARRLAVERFNWESEEQRLLVLYRRIAPHAATPHARTEAISS